MRWSAIRYLFLVPVLSLSLRAQSAASAPLAPALQPGEGLAIAGTDGVVHGYGEASKEQPMGSLAKLVWLRLEGYEWAARDVQFKCKGVMGPYHCWLAKGHGKVDLKKATQESCNLAFLAWALDSAQIWRHEYGEGASRARLEDAFSPFLGHRLKPGEELPEFGPEWIGDGDLLRTSPEAMLKWLVDPSQDELLSRCRRLLLSFLVEVADPGAWWMKTGTAPVPGDPGTTSAWVAGSNGTVTAVLHLPRGRGKAEGLARFQEILGIPKKK